MKHGVILRNVVTACILAGLFGCAGTPSPHPSASIPCQDHGHTLTCGVDHALEADVRRLLATGRPWLPEGPAPGEPGLAPFAACFDPSTPPTPETLAQLNLAMRASLAKYNAVDRWTSTAVNGNNIPTGTPITLRVSFIPDGTNAPDNGGVLGPSTLFATMDTKFGGNRALWISKIQQAFNRWGAISGVNYQFVTAAGVEWDDGALWGTAGGTTRGDVRIAMRPIDGQAGVLAFNSYPNNGDMVLDSAENWQSSGNDYRFLRNIIAHEHGHGLGLAHVCPITNPATKLMEPTLATNFDGPQQDDLRGAHFRYGDINEPNGTLGAATLVATVGVNQSFTLGSVPTPNISNGSTVSLGRDADEDWYRFDATTALLVSATATPLGTTYDSADQTSACPSGSPVNALQQADLAVSVLSNTGTLLGSASGNGLGLAESATSVLVPAGLPFYVRVYETATQTESQMYRLTVSTGTPTTFTASNGTFFEGVRLNWTAVPGVTTYGLWRATVTNRAAAVLVGNFAGTTALDTVVEGGQTYYYWLRAAQSSGVGIDIAGPVTGAASPCRVDIGKQGALPGFDNALDNNDFIVFIDLFFDGDSRADFGQQGGLAGGDGLFNNNDFIVFIDGFFAGCGA